jgi:hypothetical protein
MAEFEMISVEQMREIQNKDKEDKIDHEWAEKIATVPVGAGWKMVRSEDESQRNFKRRINAAAAAPPSFRVLDWYPQETNLPPNTDPKTYVIRVKSIDTKSKQAYEAQQAQTQNGVAAQNSQNGTSEAQQPAGAEQSTPNTSEAGEPAQPRRR